MTPEQLRQARAAGGATQSELAQTLGVTSNTVARWERGELPIPRYVGLIIELMKDLTRTQHELQRERVSHARMQERYRRLTEFHTGTGRSSRRITKGGANKVK